MSSFANLWKRIALISCLLLLLAAAGCLRTESAPAPVVILAAASTKDLLHEILAAQHAGGAPPLPIQVSSGPSQALAQQVLSGAPADIYISARRDWADQVVSAGMAEQSVEWLSNELVLVVPSGSEVTRLSDLLLPQVQRIALAGQQVPAGEYAEQALRGHGLWEKLHAGGKIIRGHDARSTLAYASRNEVDAAIVYASDAKSETNVNIVAHFDPASHEPIVYHLVRVRRKRPAPLANQVFKWLQTEQAMILARQHGFQLPPNSSPRE